MAFSKGKVYAIITILLGCTSSFLAIYVLCKCDFYEVTWVTEFGITRTDTPGLFLCKFYDSDKNPAWTGPTNGFDTAVMIGAFGAVGAGTLATFMVVNAYWNCLCRIHNNSMSSCLFMLATVLQGITALVIISGACVEQYEGSCKYLKNAYLSFAAAGGWLLASCFNRDPVYSTGTEENDRD